MNIENSLTYSRIKALAGLLSIKPGDIRQLTRTSFDAKGGRWRVLSENESHRAAQRALDDDFDHLSETDPCQLDPFINDDRLTRIEWQNEQRRQGYGSILNLIDGIEHTAEAHGNRFNVYQFD